MRMIFIFIDGFGLGENDKEKNPIVAADVPNIEYLYEYSNLFVTDTTLGIPGLPQSATGQTAIFTGVNGSKVLGRHLNGQPLMTLISIIKKNNLFKELLKRGFKVTNSNVYREEYLEKMLDPKDRRHKPSVTSVMTLSCGIKFRGMEEYKKGNGIYHDITGQILIESGYDVKLVTPEEAAERLYRVSRDYDFTLFEHFMTDIVGHKKDMDAAISEIKLLDDFLGEIIKRVNLDEDVIFITSDHGNIEDMSVKTHTYNKIPTMILGKIPENIDIRIESLTDIMPVVLKIFDNTDT